MSDEAAKRSPGRPAGSTTGRTPLRTAKIGAAWDRGQQLEADLAELEGRKANMTSYVEAALIERNARIEKQIDRLRTPE